MFTTIKNASVLITALLAAVGYAAPGALDTRQAPSVVLDFTLYNPLEIGNVRECFNSLGDRHIAPSELTVTTSEGERATTCRNETFRTVRLDNNRHLTPPCRIEVWQDANCPDFSLNVSDSWTDENVCHHAENTNGVPVELHSWRVVCPGA